MLFKKPAQSNKYQEKDKIDDEKERKKFGPVGPENQAPVASPKANIPSKKAESAKKLLPGSKGKVVDPKSDLKMARKKSTRLAKQLISRKTDLESNPKPIQSKEAANASGKSKSPFKPKATERDPKLKLIRSKPFRGSKIPRRFKALRKEANLNGVTNNVSALKRIGLEISLALKNSAKNSEDKLVFVSGVGINITDHSAVRSKILEDSRALGALKRRIADLNAQNLALEKSLKDAEKAKIPVVTPVVPSSLEEKANMNLKYQFQQSIQKERLKYSRLLAENERFAKETKEANAMKGIFKADLARQTKLLLHEHQLSHSNDIAGWRAKVRELEQDKLQMAEIITARQQELQKLIKEKDFLLKELKTITRQKMHMSDNVTLGSSERIDDLQRVSSAPKKPVPHYAVKVEKKPLQLRSGVAELIDDTSKVPKRSKVEFKNSGKPDEVRIIPDPETLRNAKIQLEYKAYVQK